MFGILEPHLEKISKAFLLVEESLFLQAGRLTLIQLVLEWYLVLQYFLSGFKLPISISKNLERIFRDFLWEGRGGEGSHLVNWEVVLKPIDKRFVNW